MAIISCPSCNQQISDKSVCCSHCDIDIANMSSESLQSQQRVKKIKQNQSIQVQTFLALLLFVGGFTVWYWEEPSAQSWLTMLGEGMIAVGFVWYIINRARLIMLNR